MDEIVLLVLVLVLGATIGSFLNVVIYRLPRHESIAFPSSHCTVCNTPIKWYDNIPIVAYIWLRGSCRSCKTHISPIYPVIEGITAFCAVLLYYNNGQSFLFIKEFTLACILLAATVIDLKFMIIPNKLNAFGAFAAFMFSFLEGFQGVFRSVVGGFVGGGIIVLMLLLGKILYKKDGVGYGDVKLAGMMGMFVGSFWIIQSFIISILIGGIWAFFVLISGKKKIGQEVPFGPFLALGGFFTLFFKQEILYLVERYLSLL